MRILAFVRTKLVTALTPFASLAPVTVHVPVKIGKNEIIPVK